mmetsp:Transcript_17818/g.43611  ORF Transcript_17818/g.43611 Transcript_17818/m.43611 type:complete len:108 (-) Transcript_17818:1699-2022(-)
MSSMQRRSQRASLLVLEAATNSDSVVEEATRGPCLDFQLMAPPLSVATHAEMLRRFSVSLAQSLSDQRRRRFASGTEVAGVCDPEVLGTFEVAKGAEGGLEVDLAGV